jgi:hypothetical protein
MNKLPNCLYFCYLQELTATANEAMELRLQLQAAQHAAVAAANAAQAREQELAQVRAMSLGAADNALLRGFCLLVRQYLMQPRQC